ncbi:hypothetical protein GJ744_009960 [Endocarpon pusillum]|uniref:Smr domain-containing protein n=1 Tax=Endocarpon pusillum TaxID=364733 RepID=A0A8H7E5V6_9EURO|nr:hypothetical protein GJ744_009960 [Endocarpon pusillum]
MDDTKAIIEKLRSDFCPPIDEPTFYSICLDYDLGNQEALGTCLENLEIIKAAAVESDTTAFDASGTGGFVARDLKTSVESASSYNGALSGSQQVESITTGLSDLAWDDDSAEGQDLDDAGDEAKVAWLTALFPDITEQNVCYRLQKCHGNLTRTIDELLNLSFIDQSEPEGQSTIPKGIDGFTQVEDHSRGRKGKAKRRLRTSDSTRSNSTTSMYAGAQHEPYNVWASIADDVEFICTRSVLRTQCVRSIYNAQNKSLARTISLLASQEGAKFSSVETSSSVEKAQIAKLRTEFPSVPESQLYGLLVMSGNKISATHELADAMITAPMEISASQTPVIAKYAPVDLTSDIESSKSRSSTPGNQVSYSKVESLAAAKAAAANTAFLQASNAYRRGKSDHLIGGAAAYYADVAHENVKAAKELSAYAADSLVMSQSTSCMLDLHGVSVADAVRIAKKQVAIWWDSLGDTKYASGGGGPVREGYRVVTGIGRHSRDGAPRIGPAVSRMLVKEGWKVTVGQGEILITGKARRS